MHGDRYSRVVGWLKIGLPLAALALLSTLFLFARAPGPQGDIPYAEIEEIARDPRVAAPAFAGVTPDGAAVSLSAAAIRPVQDAPDSLVIEAIEIGMTTDGRESLRVSAATGTFDGRAQVAALGGLVRVESSAGYLMETAGLTADLRAGTVESAGALAVRAPFGSLTAGGVTISGGGAVMVFNGGVRLIYRPATAAPATEGEEP